MGKKIEKPLSLIFKNDRVIILKNSNQSRNKLLETGIIENFKNLSLNTTVYDAPSAKVKGDITKSTTGTYTRFDEMCSIEDFLDLSSCPYTYFKIKNKQILINTLLAEKRTYEGVIHENHPFIAHKQLSLLQNFFSENLIIIAEVNADHLNYNYCLVNTELKKFIWVNKKFIQFNTNHIKNLEKLIKINLNILKTL